MASRKRWLSPLETQNEEAAADNRPPKREKRAAAILKHGAVLPKVEVDSNWRQLQASFKQAGTKRVAEKKGMRSSTGQTTNSVEAANAPGASEKNPKANLFSGNLDCSLTKAVAMDCEMVGVGPDGKRNALARVSLVNSFGNVVYDKFVRPLERVTDLRTNISGVRAGDLRKAEDFWIVQKEIAQLIFGRILVGHSVHNDLKVMFLSHPKRSIRDTSVYGPLRSKIGRPKSLRHLADEILGIKIQVGEHCSVEDARAAMLIYQRLKQQWEASLSYKNMSKA